MDFVFLSGTSECLTNPPGRNDYWATTVDMALLGYSPLRIDTNACSCVGNLYKAKLSPVAYLDVNH
jgi:hypothetical protein